MAILVIILLSGLVLWYFRVLLLLDQPSIQNGYSLGTWTFDFSVYYKAAQAFTAGEGIYQNSRFLYPPLSIFLFLPLSYLSLELAGVLWAMLTVLLLVSTIIVISKILRCYGIQPSKIELPLIFVAMFLFYPTSIAVTHGQIDILVLFLVTLFYYYLFVDRRKIVASMFLSIATMIKVWPAILVFLDFVIRRAKGLFVRYWLVFGTLCIASFAFFGLSTHVDFLNKLVGYQSLHLQTLDDIFHPHWPFAGKFNDVSIYNSIFKFLSLLGVSSSYFPHVLLGLRLIFILVSVYYLRKLKLGEKSLSSRDCNILTFTLLTILVLIVSKPLSINHGTFLVLSCILLVFVIKLDTIEKVLFMAFIALFSAQQYIVTLSNTLGGVVQSATNVASPATYAYLLFLFLTFYMIQNRIKRQARQHNK